MKLVFKKNSIAYGQDFSWHRGIPTDVVFEKDEKEIFNSPEEVWLKAYGYGKEFYGNGQILVKKADLLAAKNVIVFIEGSKKDLR